MDSSMVKEKALEYYKKAGIAITQAEADNLEIAEFGINEIEKTGLEIIVYVNTDFYCAKEMVLFPHQTCPEHRHAPLESIGYSGKMETFRCRMGTCYLYVEGESTLNPVCKPPAGSEQWYTVFKEIKLIPGEQYTIAPNTLHWFQAGDEGAVISEFSTKSYDEYDIFTNPNIKRVAD